MRRYCLAHLLLAVALFLPAGRSLIAQEAKAAVLEPVTFTTQQDHRNMQEQLGITKLRPGPSGNESAPNHANYDESLANPFPNLPEVLMLRDGKRVTTPEMWKERRAEIVEDFSREVLGRVPPNVPKVTWTVLEQTEIADAEIPAIQKRLQGKVDNSACPSIEVNIAMTLVTPKDAGGPVPVFMMFGGGFGFGPGPGKAGAPPGKAGAPPAGGAAKGPPPAPGGGRRGGFGLPAGPSRNQQLLAAKWGYATISPGSIQADNGAGLTRGIIGLTNLGQPRKPEDWGSLRAWAWGASRGLDYLETDPAVDAKRVSIEGVSRYGKAALVAMAFEPRFAAVLVGSSGEGGAKLHRRNFGEAVENLTGSGEYHWMAGNFLKYGADEAKFGSKNAGDIPVDSHELIALCAPRLTFISYGVPTGDPKWLDQQGSFMAAIAAQPVFRLLGAKDLGRSDDYMKEKMPPVNEGLLEGELAWRQHDGGHTDGPNTEHFLAWANKKLASGTVAPKGSN